MSVIVELARTVIKYVKDASKLRSLNVSDIRSIIALNLEVHDIIKSIGENNTANEIELICKKYEQNVPASRAISRNVPMLINKQYNHTAKTKMTASGHRLGALFSANSKFMAMLKDIDKNIDKVMVDKSITIFNTRLSHVALLGLLRQSELYGTYMTYLWTQIVSTAIDPTTLIPKYRSEYLLKNQATFVNITNLVSDKDGRYSFLAEMDNVKKKNANLLLYANNQTFDVFANISAYNASMMSYMTSGIAALNVFAWVGEMVDNYNHSRYLKNKNLKEWMESHSAILRLELASVDKNSPEYRKLEAVIAAYDDKITDYDRKINEYLDEE